MWTLYVILGSAVIIKQGVTASPIALGCLGPRCFWLDTDGVDWPGIGPLCMMINGSQLASIPDEETNTFLVGKLVPHGAPRVYLGAFAERFPWKWVTGASYDGNVEKQPAPPECEKRFCASLTLGSSTLDRKVVASDCVMLKRYACKKKGLPSTNENIFISLSDESWYKARYACSLREMEILTFADIPLDTLISLLKQRPEVGLDIPDVWIGIYSERYIWISSGKELIYSEISHGCEGSMLRLVDNGGWGRASTCCAQALCELILDGADTGSQEEGVPGGVDTGNVGGNKGASNEQNNQSNINIVYQVVIPIVCGAAGCIIIIAVALLVWRRSKKKRKTTKTNARLNAGKQRHNPASSNRYDNEVFKANHRNNEDYLEVTDPKYDALSESRSDHQYQEIS